MQIFMKFQSLFSELTQRVEDVKNKQHQKTNKKKNKKKKKKQAKKTNSFYSTPHDDVGYYVFTLDVRASVRPSAFCVLH